MSKIVKATPFFPAPAILDTPTILDVSQAQAVTDAINPLIADAIALWMKTKNFHWHVFGVHFQDYHVLFDDQASQILGGVDVLAERVRKVGGLTLHSIGQVVQLQTINDNNEDQIDALRMCQILKMDNLQMAQAQKDAITVCDQNGDVATSNILQSMLDETERRVWFLSMIAGV